MVLRGTTLIAAPDRLIPSFLSYVEGEEFHGTQAKSQLVRNSKNTVGYFRDYLGKEYDLDAVSPVYTDVK